MHQFVDIDRETRSKPSFRDRGNALNTKHVEFLFFLGTQQF